MASGSWRQTALPWWFPFVGVGLGIALGVVAALSFELALGSAILLLGLYLFARSGNQSEVVVAVYWLTFAVYSIIFHDITIQFFFYPFYAAFLVTLVFSLLGRGLRLHPHIAWLYVGFMVCVMASFLGLAKSIDSDVIQRLLGYIVGALVLLQFRSRKGLGTATSGAILASLAIAGYVIYNAAVLGFTYRAGVGLNPNAVALVIVFGAVTAVAWAIDRIGARGYGWRVFFVFIGVAVMLYGLALLASRGMTIALGVGVLAVLFRAVLQDWRKIGVLVLFAGMGAGALMLPGGEGIIERFTSDDEHVTSAGSRTPIWEITLQTYMASTVPRMVFGHGFDSSEPVVQRYFPTLNSTHNSYIQVLYEFGLVGLVVFSALLIYLLWLGWRTPGPQGLIMFGLTWVLVVANLSDNAADYFIYWIVMGYVMAIGTWAKD